MANTSFENELIPYVEFADNANERTPCVLVLDCSGSMRGEPIKQLNAGLNKNAYMTVVALLLNVLGFF